MSIGRFIADWLVGLVGVALLLDWITDVPGLQIVSAAIFAGFVFALIRKDMDLYDG